MLIEIDDKIVELFRLQYPNNPIEQTINDYLRTTREGVLEEIRKRLAGDGVGGIILVKAGPNVMNCIRAVREITGLGLKEAKDLVDSVGWDSGTDTYGAFRNGRPGTPHTFKRALIRLDYTMEEAAQKLREVNAVVKYNMEPRDIVAIRQEYGVYATEILRGLVEDLPNGQN